MNTFLLLFGRIPNAYILKDDSYNTSQRSVGIFSWYRPGPVRTRRHLNVFCCVCMNTSVTNIFELTEYIGTHTNTYRHLNYSVQHELVRWNRHSYGTTRLRPPARLNNSV